MKNTGYPSSNRIFSFMVEALGLEEADLAGFFSRMERDPAFKQAAARLAPLAPGDYKARQRFQSGSGLSPEKVEAMIFRYTYAIVGCFLPRPARLHPFVYADVSELILRYNYVIRTVEVPDFDRTRVAWCLIQRLFLPMVAANLAEYETDHNLQINPQLPLKELWYVPNTREESAHGPMRIVFDWWMAGAGFQTLAQVSEALPAVRRGEIEVESARRELRRWRSGQSLPPYKKIQDLAALGQINGVSQHAVIGTFLFARGFQFAFQRLKKTFGPEGARESARAFRSYYASMRNALIALRELPEFDRPTHLPVMLEGVPGFMPPRYGQTLAALMRGYNHEYFQIIRKDLTPKASGKYHPRSASNSRTEVTPGPGKYMLHDPHVEPDLRAMYALIKKNDKTARDSEHFHQIKADVEARYRARHVHAFLEGMFHAGSNRLPAAIKAFLETLDLCRSRGGEYLERCIIAGMKVAAYANDRRSFRRFYIAMLQFSLHVRAAGYRTSIAETLWAAADSRVPNEEEMREMCAAHFPVQFPKSERFHSGF